MSKNTVARPSVFSLVLWAGMTMVALTGSAYAGAFCHNACAFPCGNASQLLVWAIAFCNMKPATFKPPMEMKFGRLLH